MYTTFAAIFIAVFGWNVISFMYVLGTQRYVAYVAVAIFALLISIETPFAENMVVQLVGLTFFIWLYNLGTIVMKNRLSKIFKWVSTISYQIFLIQHIVVGFLQSIWNPRGLIEEILWMAITVIVAVLMGKIVYELQEIVKLMVNRLKAYARRKV